MSLRNDRTAWVFFLTSSGKNPETRHMKDLAHGVSCLLDAGIRKESIFIIVDGNNRKQINAICSPPEPCTIQVHTMDVLKDAETILNDFNSLVVFVFGHGNGRGIDSESTITPYMLVSAIRRCRSIKQSVVFLAICYAGLFKYLPVNNDRIVILGGTELQSSIATFTSETVYGIVDSWIADIFFYYVFRWFMSPVDMDGDGLLTIMDCYKYAALLTNDSYMKVKIRRYSSLPKTIKKYEKKMKRLERIMDGCNIMLKKKERKAYRDLLDKTTVEYRTMRLSRDTDLSIAMFNQQDPWIMNAFPAMEIEY